MLPEELLKHLKSNMDRFIGLINYIVNGGVKDLKSNMDRFIGNSSL